MVPSETSTASRERRRVLLAAESAVDSLSHRVEVRLAGIEPTCARTECKFGEFFAVIELVRQQQV